MPHHFVVALRDALDVFRHFPLAFERLGLLVDGCGGGADFDFEGLLFFAQFSGVDTRFFECSTQSGLFCGQFTLFIQ